VDERSTAAMTGPGPWREKRTLLQAAVFDPKTHAPITYLHFGPEVTPEGPQEALVLEAHGNAGLQTEHLKTGDWIDCEYDSFWPHKIPDPEHAVGTYVDRWIVRLIWGMSRPSPSPLRVPPLPKAEWGVFELACYSQHLAQVRGGW
jgi:hypothetical protein